MNATSRTLVFAAVAAISALAAVSAWFGSRPAVVEGYADVGTEFFADFTDPLKATSLSVTEFNDKTKEAQSFAVRQNDKGEWVIPSHHDYPAEAQERLARTAASLLGVSKTAVQSRNKDDWKLYAVVDPSAEGAATKTERGTRVSLRDASGNALVDLIVGRKVDGRENHYYVREPEKNTTYIAQMKPDLSAKFSDWIEPDLLKVNQADIVSITVDNYSIDEQQGAILKGETLEFTKEELKSTGKWKLQGVDEATEKIDESPIRTIATNLDNLKIVGVRPKPEGLNADLTVSPEVARNPLLREVLQADMQRQGFYVANGPNGGVRLVSNEGELLAGAANGVQYTLYFGEVARGSDKDIEVGFADKAAADKSAEGEASKSGESAKGDDSPTEAATDEAAKKSEEESGDAALRRYLLVKVNFDEALLGAPPTEPVPPVKPELLSDPPAASEQPAPAEPAAAEPAPASEPKPAAETPKAEEPKAEEPKAEEPKTDAPKADEPKESTKTEDESSSADGSCDPQEEPKADEPKAEDTKEEQPAAAEPAAAQEPAQTEEPKSAPAAETPATETPATEAPATVTPAAETSAPAAPATEAPAAAAQTEQPAAAPPVDPQKAADEQYNKAMGEYEAKKAAWERDIKAREEKIKEGRKVAEELSARFSGWYYVISADSFEKFRIQRKDVVSLKTADDAKTEGAEGGPGGGFNLPPGLNFPPGLNPGNQ